MKPRVVTLQSIVDSVPDRWDVQYPRDGAAPDKLRIGFELRLARAHQKLSAELAAQIIGNDLWTNIRCDACGQERLQKAVIVGEAPDYDSSTATLCEACLREALDALTASP